MYVRVWVCVESHCKKANLRQKGECTLRFARRVLFRVVTTAVVLC